MALSKKTITIILAFFAIYVVWGSTYLLNKIAVSELPPFKLAALRFMVAGLLIFLIAKLFKIHTGITKKQFINTAIAGFLFLTFGNGIAVWALKYIDSGFAALEISAQPLIVLVLMRIFQNKRISNMAYVGVFLGFIGVFLLVSQKEMINERHQIIGMIMIFVCMLSWAFGSLFVGKADLPSNYFVNTAYQMLFGGVMLAIGSLCIGETWTMPNTWSPDVQLAMLILIVFGSIIAFTAFNYLLKEVSPEKVATSTYVNPIIALFLGWWILNESLTFQSIIAAIILLTGVYFINSNRVVKPRGIGR